MTGNCRPVTGADTRTWRSAPRPGAGTGFTETAGEGWSTVTFAVAMSVWVMKGPSLSYSFRAFGIR
jgi:hypothetical protein